MVLGAATNAMFMIVGSKGRGTLILSLLVSVLVLSFFHQCQAFLVAPSHLLFATRRPSGNTAHRLNAQTTTANPTIDPIVFSCGYSQKPDLLEALRDAVEIAVASLPETTGDSNTKSIDLALVSVSSLYDGGIHPPATVTVSTIIEALQEKGWALQQLVGSTVAGCIASSSPARTGQSCQPSEYEGVPAVSITLANLPDTNIRTFHVSAADVPDDYGRYPAREWKRATGLLGVGNDEESEEKEDDPVVFFLIPSPAFQKELDNLLQGLSVYFPGSQIIGGIASTVSSLSRAKLFSWRRPKNPAADIMSSAAASNCCWADGCVGVALQGDVALHQMKANGAKPVGGIYQILKGEESTISVIVLDEAATEALEEEEEADDADEEEAEEEESTDMDARAKMAQFYAKARIPKPLLAEANFVMRSLSDDDQAFMRRQLLVGLEQGGSFGRTASELKRLADGEGHRFTVHQVASAAMKDGSVRLPLGSVDIKPGTRLRFFVRESEFAKKEIDALWLGYKKRMLSEQFASPKEGEDKSSTFSPAACILIPTLDRGNKFFLGKGFESGAVARMLQGIPSISGFFSNGVIGKMDISETAPTGVQGSASGYFLLGSKSGRPVYSPAAAADEKAARKEQQDEDEAVARAVDAEDRKRSERVKSLGGPEERAPRSEDGELIIKRREVHSGRALTVSTVEWSVAEKTAQPTSALEGFMWDKETEVDRFRERVPLVNLVSQCRLAATDPTLPKPREWIGPLKEAALNGFVIVPECKRMEPTTGSLRRRYDLPKLIRDFTLAGAPVISVNCDSILFGGSLEDITKARQAASAAAVEQISDDGVVVPPILASDLILYPYQLYKLWLAGADAVNLVAGALASKDMKYLTKIAASLNLQTLVSVTSEVQIRALSDLPVDGGIDGVILSNRELEDMSFDLTGEQALRLLRSDVLRELRDARGSDFPILVEGRVGIIERPDANGEISPYHYIRELKEAGATGAIVGGGLVAQASDGVEAFKSLQANVK